MVFLGESFISSFEIALRNPWIWVQFKFFSPRQVLHVRRSFLGSARFSGYGDLRNLDILAFEVVILRPKFHSNPLRDAGDEFTQTFSVLAGSPSRSNNRFGDVHKGAPNQFILP